jgi:hypothetical protein
VTFTAKRGLCDARVKAGGGSASVTAECVCYDQGNVGDCCDNLFLGEGCASTARRVRSCSRRS